MPTVFPGTNNLVSDEKDEVYSVVFQQENKNMIQTDSL